jgi:hypothetical protein
MMAIKHRHIAASIGLAVLLLFLPGRSYLHAQVLPMAAQDEDPSSSIYLNVESHSGTPLVLEFVLKAPKDIVRSVSLDFESDGQYDLTINRPQEEVVFRGIPYRKPGTYRATAYIHTSRGNVIREYVIAFTDFVWGRDNYTFANDGKYEDSGDFVSETLIRWAEDRFGDLSSEERVLLLSVMYDIYKGSIGRCYGFTGEQIYYITGPDRLPEHYASLYEIREEDAAVFRNMDYIQNDIVFSNFLTGKIKVQEKQPKNELLRELHVVRQSLEKGMPIIIGYLSRKMHHSMVVYGYIHNLFRDRVTLVTANNWEREQNNNTFSEDAENIVIDLGGASTHLSWYDLTKKRYRYPKSIFAVHREEHYSLSMEDYSSLLRRTRRRIIDEDRIVIMVEKTETALLEDAAGKRQGYSKPRYYREIDEISFKKIDYNYIFELPADADREYRLILKKRRYNEQLDQYKPVNLYSIIPTGTDEGIYTATLKDLPVEDEQELVFRVSREGIHPE